MEKAIKGTKTPDYYIKTVWLAISRMYNTHASKFNMSMPIGFVLMNIDKEGTPATKIAPSMGLETRSLTRILKKLEEDKWIIRKANKKDKRVVKIFLTELGIEKREIVKRAIIAFNTELAKFIPESEITTMVQTLNKVHQVVDSITVLQKDIVEAIEENLIT
jgi:MarR family transcriptional regulator, organic hydroperoxide resistance regulator